MTDYPPSLVEPGHTAPIPRRIRALRDGAVVVDTTHALYLWEWPHYPQYAIPREDVALGDDALAELDHRVLETGHIRLAWDALDAWFEEDEQVFVHPRNPYARVDALRSSRPIQIQRDGVVLAQAASAIHVFETGLPTRYYLDRTAVAFERLQPSATITACPYKGKTSNYWSAGGTDVAWAYDFPTLALSAIAGLVAFFNERVDITLDGASLPRPRTPFSD